MANKQIKTVETSTEGIITALSAFFIWGMFPLYFKQLDDYNFIEIISHRIIWTFVLLFLVVLVLRKFSWVPVFKREPKWLLVTFFSAILITGNWLTYVWAVNHGQILSASLGYFMSPLMGVGLSLLVLKEKLRPLQWLAIGLASLAVLVQIVIIGSLPWVSLSLALTFSVYGILQRQTPLKAIDALFIETFLIVPFVLLWLHNVDVKSSHLSFWFSKDILLLMCAGPITLIPLLLFNKSTKIVAFNILSFMNYLTPSFIFLLAVYYYNEHFDMHKLGTFILIWAGLIIFSIDLIKHRTKKAVAN